MDSAFNEVNALKCDLASEVLCSSGSLRLCVTGWSMLPTIMPGDTLKIERISSQAACEGDIVLFGRDHRLFAHRVVSRREWPLEGIVTRGDAMATVDAPVLNRDLLGRVSLIVRNGKCLDPKRKQLFPQRVVTRVVRTLVRRSTFAARVVVGLHGRYETLRDHLQVLRYNVNRNQK